MMPRFWKLNDDNSVSPCTMEEWLEKSFKQNHVAYSDLMGYSISTVFLGLNHQYENGPPILFETMIFFSWEKANDIKEPDELDYYQERCSTFDEALVMHNKAVQMVRRKSIKLVG